MQELSRHQIEISNTLGLHLRAADRFVRLSQQFQAEVRVSCNGHAADGRSILELLMLVAGCGALVELEAIGPDAPAAAIALSALIENGFHDAEEETNERPGSSLA